MTVARGDDSQIDALVVVVEPYPRSAEVAKRLLEMADAKGITRRVVVANKITGPEDLDAIRGWLGVEPDIIIPDDTGVSGADKAGESPMDHAPNSDAVDALRELATSLMV